MQAVFHAPKAQTMNYTRNDFGSHHPETTLATNKSVFRRVLFLSRRFDSCAIGHT